MMGKRNTGVKLLFCWLLLAPGPVGFAEDRPKLSEQMIEAAEEGDIKEMRELIERGADVNAIDEQEGITALIAATAGGQVAAVQFLIQAKAAVNSGDKANNATPLMWAATLRPDKEAIEKGLKMPPAEKKLEIGRMLIAAGAEVNYRNAWGGTALQWAADEGNPEMVKLLLASKADPNLGDQHGLTPLIAAAHYDGPAHFQIAEQLIRAGAKLELSDAIGKTALMASTNNYGPAMTSALIKAGAKVDAADRDGFTALMYACRLGRAETAKVLIDSGAGINAKSKDGRSALQIARDAGFKPAIEVLLKAGASE